MVRAFGNYLSLEKQLHIIIFTYLLYSIMNYYIQWYNEDVEAIANYLEAFELKEGKMRCLRKIMKIYSNV